MHVSSDRDLVEIREGTMYYQLDEYFSYKGSSSMMRIYLLQDCVVGSKVSECVKRPIGQFTRAVALDPNHNCAKK